MGPSYIAMRYLATGAESSVAIGRSALQSQPFGSELAGARFRVKYVDAEKRAVGRLVPNERRYRPGAAPAAD
jgi:hypothetical protein